MKWNLIENGPNGPPKNAKSIWWVDCVKALHSNNCRFI